LAGCGRQDQQDRDHSAAARARTSPAARKAGPWRWPFHRPPAVMSMNTMPARPRVTRARGWPSCGAERWWRSTRVRGPQMDPVPGREVADRQQLVNGVALALARPSVSHR